MRAWLRPAFALVQLVGLIAVVGAFAVQSPPTAIQNDSAKWEYDDVDLIAGPVTLFLVCLDGQPTSACAQVPVSSGVAGPVAGTKTFTWKFPPLLAGPHSVAVQACTAGAASCSTGVSLAFTFQAIANPKNLRLGSR